MSILPNRQDNHHNFVDRKLLKDLPFYRRYPRTFVIVGSTLGFLILFSKGFYDIFKSDTPDDIQKKLYIQKLKQLKLQEEFEYVTISHTVIFLIHF